jgi:hypothetical protein
VISLRLEPCRRQHQNREITAGTASCRTRIWLAASRTDRPSGALGLMIAAHVRLERPRLGWFKVKGAGSILRAKQERGRSKGGSKGRKANKAVQ